MNDLKEEETKEAKGIHPLLIYIGKHNLVCGIKILIHLVMKLTLVKVLGIVGLRLSDVTLVGLLRLRSDVYLMERIISII